MHGAVHGAVHGVESASAPPMLEVPLVADANSEGIGMCKFMGGSPRPRRLLRGLRGGRGCIGIDWAPIACETSRSLRECLSPPPSLMRRSESKLPSSRGPDVRGRCGAP